MSGNTTHYAARPPVPPLTPYVQCLWSLSGPAGGGGSPETIVPDGRMELVIQCGDPFAARGANGAFAFQPRALLAGQLEGPLLLRATGRVETVGVRFTSWGAAAFVREDLWRLSGLTPDVESIWGAVGRALVNRMGAASGADERMDQLERFLIDLLPGARRPSRLHRIVALLQQRRGRLPVETMASLSGLGARQIERHFRAEVGLAPRDLARIVRFQAALRARRERPDDGWAAVAHDAGYCDQSHLVRDFRKYTGHTPTGWAAASHPLADSFTA